MWSVKKITLKSRDGVLFKIDVAVAKHMMIPVDSASHKEVLTLPNETSDIMAKVIEYSKKHVAYGDRAADEELKAWDAEFVKLDPPTLCGLIQAAQRMQGLTDLTAKAIADLIGVLTPEQIKKTFNIQKAFTRQTKEDKKVEEEVRRWLEEWHKKKESGAGS